jgi:hypothetical protein
VQDSEAIRVQATFPGLLQFQVLGHHVSWEREDLSHRRVFIRFSNTFKLWLGQRPRDLTPDRATRCLDMQRQPLSTRPSNPHDLADLPSRTPIGAQGEP